MKIFISDYHVGCQIWQASLLEKLKHLVIVNNCNWEYQVLLKNYNQTKYINTNLNVSLLTENNLLDSESKSISEEFDIILCSFPPKIIDIFNNVKCKYPKILNCGHRLHIYSKNDKDFLINLKKKIKNNEIILCSMSIYDTEYIKHYLDINPIELYVTCCYLPNIKFTPNKREILIAPVNAVNLNPFNTVNEMNQFALNNGFDLQFAKIKDLYSNYDFSDLLNHRACVLFPYSAFSIYMVEMYELNIPMFVPSKKFIIEYNLMQDVCLFPYYCSNDEMLNVDIPNINSPHKYSPNSYNREDRDYWLNYSYFYNKKNVIIWDSIYDLFIKLINTNFQEVSYNMSVENDEFRNKQINNWENLINNLEKYI